jgi:hypothetical protein
MSRSAAWRARCVAAALHLLPAGPALAQTNPAASRAPDTYVVQVATQRTEAAARSAFQALQQKHPSDLAGRQVVIRRVEHPNGALYQGEIGPFGTASEADTLCDRLMAAGAACVVALAPQPSAAAPVAVATASEPKRVKTVIIRPGPDGSSSARPGSEPTTATPAAPAAGEPKRIRTTTIRPDGSETAAPTAGAPQPVAFPPGTYVVQVSAQRTEAEARLAFAALQQKYPMLGGREPVLRRVELGGSGVWYRAQVGPFSSGSAADEFCVRLKNAGGQCIIQRN